MNLTSVQKQILSKCGSDYISATKIAEQIGCCSAHVIRLSKEMVEKGVVIQEAKPFKTAPIRLKLGAGQALDGKKEMPNFDRLLFSTKW